MIRGPSPPRWAQPCLLAAGLYNLAFGSLAVLCPSAMLRWLGLGDAQYPQLWQCIGMIVGVYGLAYAAAAIDSRRFWPIVLVGLLGKVLGPIGFVAGSLQGDLPLRFGLVNLTNDLIWWIPFTLLMIDAWPTMMADLGIRKHSPAQS